MMKLSATYYFSRYNLEQGCCEDFEKLFTSHHNVGIRNDMNNPLELEKLDFVFHFARGDYHANFCPFCGKKLTITNLRKVV